MILSRHMTSGRRYGALGKAAMAVSLAGAVAIAGPAQGAKLPKKEGQHAEKQAAHADRDLKVMLLIDRAPLAEFLPDDKDAGIRSALAMIPDRLAELPKEMGDRAPEIDPEMIRGFLGDSQRRVRLVVFDTGFDEETGRPGIGAWAAVSAESEDDAQHLTDRIRGLAEMAPGGMPIEDAPGGLGHWQIDLPIGPLDAGPVELAPGDWAMAISVGARASASEVGRAVSLAPEGVSPAFQGKVDLASLAPLTGMLGMVATAADPKAAMFFQQFVQLGLIGPQAIGFEYVFGYSDDNLVSRWTVTGLKAFASHWGLSHRTLTDMDLAAIPADATVAYMGKFDWSAVWRWIELTHQMDAAFPEKVNEVEQMLGVSPRDILDAMGSTSAVYMSDATGGGSILSGVAMVSVNDRDTLWTAITNIAGMMNHHLSSQMDRAEYARISLATHGDTSFATLDIRGIPMPFRPSVVLTDDWMLVGVTPQATKAAWMQVQGEGDNGLASNPHFARARFHGDKGLVAIEWIDSPRVMRDGYMVATLVGNAMRSAVLSPHGDDRDPGLVTPTFADLREDAKPMLLMAYWERDDLVLELQADRSLLVNASGLIGAFVSTAALLEPIAVIGAAEAASQKAKSDNDCCGESRQGAHHDDHDHHGDHHHNGDHHDHGDDPPF